MNKRISKMILSSSKKEAVKQAQEGKTVFGASTIPQALKMIKKDK